MMDHVEWPLRRSVILCVRTKLYLRLSRRLYA